MNKQELENYLNGSNSSFVIKSFNQMMEDAENTPDPKDLYMGLWAEGEIACLFAESNVGKSILAVQIVEHIGKEQPVLYVDCELLEKQVQLRYKNEETNIRHQFSEKCYRAEYSSNVLSDETQRLRDIEIGALALQAKVIVIDNLTALCNDSESGEAAGRFMLNLKQLQMKHKWAILVIAHTPKRLSRAPLTANDLAGSKKLFNLFDTVFALGKSYRDPNERYLKQLKYRRGEFLYTEDNVLVLHITKQEDGSLFLSDEGTATEAEMLQTGFLRSQGEVDRIYELRSCGYSYREIEKMTGVSRSKANKIMKYAAPSFATPTSTMDCDPFYEEEIIKEDLPLSCC